MTWGQEQSYSLGNGTATQVFFQHQPDSSNWIAGAGLNMLIGNRNPARIYEGAGDTLQIATLTANSLRMFFQLGYAWQVKKFNFQLNAGVLLPIASGLKEEINYHDSFTTISQTSSIKNYFSFGFKGSLICSYSLHKNINFFFMIDNCLLNPKVKSKTIYKYDNSGGKQLDEVYPTTSDREYIYRKNVEDIENNKDISPKTFNPDNPTERLSYNQSYSSLGFQFGFQFLF